MKKSALKNKVFLDFLRVEITVSSLEIRPYNRGAGAAPDLWGNHSPFSTPLRARLKGGIARCAGWRD